MKLPMRGYIVAGAMVLLNLAWRRRIERDIDITERKRQDTLRVARELRDDASQQIAGLSIMWISRSTTTAAGSTRRSHRWMVSG